MVAYIFAELFIGFVLSMLSFVFITVPAHNMIMTRMFSMGLVISQYDYDVANVIMWFVIGIPMLILVGFAVYTYDAITYRTTGG